jgi:hypothetical protein
MPELLTVRGEHVEGELALNIPPGTVAAERDRALDVALTTLLGDIADKLGAVLASPPHRFARVLPGKDVEGRDRFMVRGRAEGGRLIPDHSNGVKNSRRQNERRS